MGNGLSFGAFIYLVIGLVIAANHHYLTALNTFSGIVSALLAIVLWPLLLFGVNLHIALGGMLLRR